LFAIYIPFRTDMPFFNCYSYAVKILERTPFKTYTFSKMLAFDLCRHHARQRHALVFSCTKRGLLRKFSYISRPCWPHQTLASPSVCPSS